jgi:hypothetical protein
LTYNMTTGRYLEKKVLLLYNLGFAGCIIKIRDR